MIKSIRQQFNRRPQARSLIWKVGFVIVGLSLFVVVGWVRHSSLSAIQGQQKGSGATHDKADRLSDYETRLQAQAAELAKLRKDLARQRAVIESLISPKNGVKRAKPKQLSHLENELQQIDRRLKDLELDQSMIERITAATSPSICMIVGEYVWVDRTSGMPLRYEGVSATGRPTRWSDRLARISAGGQGPLLARQFSGTGFLIDASGAVITSGYLLAPWERDRIAQQAGKMQMVPRIQVLHAYFPGVNRPFDLTVSQISNDGNIVICRFDPGTAHLRGLPLRQPSRGVTTGEPIVLLGYSGGVDLMQARLPTAEQQEIIRSGKRSNDEIAQELARRGWIQPLAIQGRISGHLGGRLFYDATTTYGGSGGPLLDSRGEVLGIEFAISPEFSGSNLAISVSSIQGWLAANGFGAQNKASSALGQHRIKRKDARPKKKGLNARYVK